MAVCYGQEAAVYNINKFNGLSSNHVYTTLVDKSGYLWIATTKGLFKYNGYTLRKFDYEDGLPNLDIWNLYQDHKGKIWLCTITNQFGYIYNNKYYNTYKKPANDMPVIYPSNIVAYGDSLVFMNKALTQINHSGLSIVVGDTIYRKLIDDYSQELYPSNSYNLGTVVLEIFEDIIYITHSSEYINTPNGGSYQPQFQNLCQINLQKQLQTTTCNGTFAKRYIYYLNRNIAACCIYDYKQNVIDTIRFEGKNKIWETPIHTYEYNNRLYTITAKSIYTIDSRLKIIQRVDLDSLFGSKKLHGVNNTFFLSDSFWGNMLSTGNNGLYIGYQSNKDFIQPEIDLTCYRYVGKVDDSTGFWWNRNAHKLICVNNGEIIKSYLLRSIQDITKIVPFNNSNYILLNNHNSSFLQKNGEINELVHGYEFMKFRNKNTSFFNGASEIASGILGFLADCAVIDSNSIYVVGPSYNGVNKITFNSSNRYVNIDSVYFDKYSNIAYNSLNKTAFVYSSDKVLMINDRNGKKVFITNDQLHALGINGIEKIAADDFGNVFIKDYNRLIIANIFTNESRQLFKNYELQDAFIDLENNVLSLAGTFGVIRAKVLGPNKISTITAYPNTKRIFYSFVKDVHFSSDNILLKTDKGTYQVNTSFIHSQTAAEPDYRIMLSYDKALVSISNNDTISINQTVNNIAVDVIKPTGTGIFNIQYSINGSSYISSGYQIILPDLKLGSYNTVSIIATDDSWKSAPIKFNLYFEPYWWQTKTAKRIMFPILLLSAMALVYIIIIITRKAVNKNNDRRNQRRELELKSIYSQINPHFIFNSLSTAQYFVKKNMNKEAYEHINQFSDLLRAYIKSSRNKYISITEEIENLHNYLQLQLTRFEEKFDYHIKIDESVNPNVVKIPSLLLQPIVENALNHGIFHSEKKGLLNISFTIDKNVLVCVVDDNGIGRKKSKEIRSELIQKASSYGTILIKELIDTFNKYENIKIEIEYIDNEEPNIGTTVIIKIENYNHV